MANWLSKETLLEISGFITAHMGLYFPEDRLNDLERGLLSASREFGFGDMEDFIRWLKSSQMTKERVEIMAGHLTVGETYFFREKETLHAVQTRILPEIIAARQAGERRIRIWSAGCSTGEEPYTIAIILHRLLGGVRDWNITILATDINPASLKKARAGVYGEWSFRDVPAWLKDTYFNHRDNGYEIVPFIKDMVTFEYLNLADDVYPSLVGNTNAMDIIFCRNVLMYFKPELAKKVLTAFHNALVEKGFLLVSPCEAITSITTLFAMENYQDATLYRKDSDRELEQAPQKERAADEFKKKPVTSPAAPKKTAVEAKKRPAPPVRTEASAYELAIGMFNQGRFKDAASALESGNALDAKSMTLLARAYANAGELGRALSWCEKAIAQDALTPYRHYLKATILQEDGRIQEAVSELKRAIYLDQGFAIAYFALGNLFAKLGDAASSAKSFKNALEIASSFSTDDIIPESEGITAGRLCEIITSITKAQ